MGTADLHSHWQTPLPATAGASRRCLDRTWGSYFFYVCAFLFFSGARVFHLQAYATNASQADPTALPIMVLVYACFLPFLFANKAVIGRAAKYPVGVWAMVALAYCSALWSKLPASTVKQSTILLATTAFGVYFGARFKVSEQIRILAIALGWAIALSALAGALFPAYGVMAYTPVGAWCGIYTHRNEFCKNNCTFGAGF